MSDWRTMKWVTRFPDRHGKMRYRFRRMGFTAYFQSEMGTPQFIAEYEQFKAGIKAKEMETPPPPPIISLVRQLGSGQNGEYVYFVEAENGLVKIGHTKNIRERFKKIHTATPSQLMLLGLTRGDRALEQRLHSVFAKDRVTGEWFNSSRELQELARSNEAPKV